MKECIIIIDDNYIKIEYAKNFFDRFRGLMGRKNFTGLLFKQKNNNRYLSSIHSCFMRVSIDLVFVDNNMRVCELKRLKTWKVHIPKENNIKYIIELPVNSIEKYHINLTTKLRIVSDID